MPTTYPPVDVKLKGGVYMERSFKDAKISTLGSNVNAVVKLYEWTYLDEETTPRFVEVDRLTNASIVANANDPKKMTITGLSDLAREMVRGGTEEEWTVTWEAAINGNCGDDCG